MELTFQVTNVREKEDKQEDGTVKKVRYEVLNKIYNKDFKIIYLSEIIAE